MPSTHARRPRFERASVRRMVLTPRDIELLRAVRRHRFLRSTHLVALAGGSRQAVLRRLQVLFHHGYLARPVIQLDWYTRGSQPLVYALGKDGAKALAAVGERRGIRFDTKNRSLSRVFLHHTLAIADVMVAFEVTCRENRGVRLISPDEVYERAPNATRALRRPFRWHVEVRAAGRRHRLGIEPDRVFGLRFVAQTGSEREAFFFLEADRGTMPVARKDLAQTSFVRKLVAYEATWRQKLHTAQLGIPNFRVLTVTATSRRLNNLVAVCRSLPRAGSRLYLFASREALNPEDILASECLNGRGDRTLIAEFADATAATTANPSPKRGASITGSGV